MNRHTNRQALELYVEEMAGDLLNLRLTSGSGNQLGDADLKPKHKGNSHTPEIVFECKDKSTTKTHSVPTNDWNKALEQAGKSSGILVFVTRNSEGEVVGHLKFKDLIGIIKGYEWTIEALEQQLETQKNTQVE